MRYKLLTLTVLTLCFFAAGANNSFHSPSLPNVSGSTTQREISISAGSLAWDEYDPDTVEAAGGTVNFAPTPDAVAGFTLARPADWSGNGLVRVVLVFTLSPTKLTGTVEWRLLVAAADKGNRFGPGQLYPASSPWPVDGNRLYTQAFWIPPAALDKSIWRFEIGRGHGSADVSESYNDVLRLHSVQVTYPALTDSLWRSQYRSAGEFSFRPDSDPDAVIAMNTARGLWWKEAPSPVLRAGIQLPRPQDWDDDTPMTVRLHFEETTGAAGVVRWKANRSFNDAQLFGGAELTSDAPSVFSGGVAYRYYSQDFTLADNPFVTDQPHWGISFFRGDASDGHSYDGPLRVLGAELIYQRAATDNPAPAQIQSISGAGMTYPQVSTGIQPIPNHFEYWGLRFPADVEAKTGFGVHRPDDWDGVSDVAVHLVYFIAGYGAGAVRWRLAMLDLNSGDSLRGTYDLEPTGVPLIIGDSIYDIHRQTFVIPAAALLGDWLQFQLQRGSDSVGESFDDDLVLLHVAIDYSGSANEDSLFANGFE